MKQNVEPHCSMCVNHGAPSAAQLTLITPLCVPFFALATVKGKSNSLVAVKGSDCRGSLYLGLGI